MNQENKYILILSINLCMFCFILKLDKCSAVDPHFVACQPVCCGYGPNISFPFYIQGKQESYCGIPGFELKCTEQGFPVLQISETEYIVENISYQNHTFQLQNSIFNRTGNGCNISEIKNVTIDNRPLRFVSDSKIQLLSECNESLPENLLRHKISCGEENSSDWGLAMFGDNRSLETALQLCEKHVTVPVEMLKDEGNNNGVVDYKQILARGFRLNWTARNCSECAESGGRCGFDVSDFKFQCFCPDRPHSASCKPTNKGKDQVNCSAMPCESYVAAPVEIGDKSNLNGRHINCVRLLEDGFTLQWSGIRCSSCERSGGHCGFENGEPVCYCSDRSHQNHCSSGKRRLGLILGSVLGGAVLIFLLVTFIVCRYKKKHNGYFCFCSRNKSSDPFSENDVEEGSIYHGVPVFSHAELEEATCKFDSSRELGDGGFGAVYYGKLQDGREVAVKRLYEHNCKRMEQFKNEVEILTRLKHRNLVTLYGCTSKHSRELLLVYEYISNGTVADHLHGDRAKEGFLAWPIRMNIAIETASALVYLHASDIIHRDVKTNNILIDNNCCVKVADFGLSRLFPNDVTHVSTAPQGTPGYVDPDYHECYQLTNKSDVYSFGVVLVELISSMPAVDITRHRQEINLSNLAINKIQRRAFDELIDPSLGFASDADVKRMTTSVAELAFRCLQVDKDLRPTMDEVLKTLKIIQGIHEDEKADDSIINNTEPNDENAPTFPKADDKALLTKMQIPPSPISVTEKWISTSSING